MKSELYTPKREDKEIGPIRFGSWNDRNIRKTNCDPTVQQQQFIVFPVHLLCEFSWSDMVKWPPTRQVDREKHLTSWVHTQAKDEVIRSAKLWWSDHPRHVTYVEQIKKWAVDGARIHWSQRLSGQTSILIWCCFLCIQALTGIERPKKLRNLRFWPESHVYWYIDRDPLYYTTVITSISGLEEN